MISSELHILLNPRLWKHKGRLPVLRRQQYRDLVNELNFGFVMEGKLTMVWVGIMVADPLPRLPIVIHYPSPEKLLVQWKIDQ
jgi:hypothetical protein